jgi:hypothetical protein
VGTSLVVAWWIWWTRNINPSHSIELDTVRMSK